MAEAVIGNTDDAGAGDAVEGEHELLKQFRLQFESAGFNEVVQASTDGENPVSEFTGIGGDEPARFGKGFVVRQVAVAVGDHGAAEVDTAIADADVGAGDGLAVIHTAAGGFGGAVCGHHIDAQLGCRVEHFRVDAATADQDGVEKPQGFDPGEGAHDFVELHRGERGVHPVAGGSKCFGACDEVGGAETVGEVHEFRFDARDHAAYEDLQARDVVRRHGQQPLARTTQSLMGGIGAGDEVHRRELSTLRRARGTGGGHHHRDIVCDGLAGAHAHAEFIRPRRVIRRDWEHSAFARDRRFQVRHDRQGISQINGEEFEHVGHARHPSVSQSPPVGGGVGLGQRDRLMFVRMKSGELVVTSLAAGLALVYTVPLFTGHVAAQDWVQVLLSWCFVGALSRWQRNPLTSSTLMVLLNVAWSVLWVAAPTNIGYAVWVMLVPLAVYTGRRHAQDIPEDTRGGSARVRGMWQAKLLTAVAAAWCFISPFMWTWDEDFMLFYRRPPDAALTLLFHWAVIAVAYLLAVSGAAEEETKKHRSHMREQRLVAAREEERLNTARDIHDVLGHSLTLIKVQAHAGLTAGTERESLELIRDTAGDALADIRLLVKGLRDEGPGLTPAGTAESLPAVIERFRTSGLEVTLDAPERLNVPTVTAQALNRIVAEALTNAVKHQENPVAEVAVEQRAEAIRVTVSSVGRTQAHPGAGTGIVGMRERARATGGTFDIEHEDNKVTVTAVLGV